MKTKVSLLSFFFLFLNYNSIIACHDDTIICYETVPVSLGPICSVEITPDIVLYEVCPEKSYKVQLFDDPPTYANELPNPIDGSYLGTTIVAVVTDVASNNSCTANIVLQDKTPPFIDFVGSPANLSCQDDLSEVISIGVFDNCGRSEYKILDIRHDCVPCEYDSVFITYELVDEYGNVGHETKGFEFADFCMDVDFPEDVTFSCPPDMDEIPGITVSDSDRFCPLAVTIDYSDIRLGCDISRIYTISEDCSGRTIRHTQIIDVEDFDPPTLEIVPVDGPISLDEYNDGFRPLYVSAAFCGILYTSIDKTIKEVISCDPARFLVLYEIQTVDICFNSSPKRSIIVEVVAEDPPKVKISGKKDCLRDFTVTAKPRDMVEPITYSWASTNSSWSVTPIPGTNTASVSPARGRKTYISVTATDALGCVQTDTKSYYCKRNPFGFAQNQVGLSLFPNPATDHVNLTLEEMILSVEVYSLSGKKMISLTGINSHSLTIDMDNLVSGLYFMQVKSETDTWTEKLIKE